MIKLLIYHSFHHFFFFLVYADNDMIIGYQIIYTDFSKKKTCYKRLADNYSSKYQKVKIKILKNSLVIFIYQLLN